MEYMYANISIVKYNRSGLRVRVYKCSCGCIGRMFAHGGGLVLPTRQCAAHAQLRSSLHIAAKSMYIELHACIYRFSSSYRSPVGHAVDSCILL